MLLPDFIDNFEAARLLLSYTLSHRAAFKLREKETLCGEGLLVTLPIRNSATPPPYKLRTSSITTSQKILKLYNKIETELANR